MSHWGVILFWLVRLFCKEGSPIPHPIAKLMSCKGSNPAQRKRQVLVIAYGCGPGLPGSCFPSQLDPIEATLSGSPATGQQRPQRAAGQWGRRS